MCASLSSSFLSSFVFSGSRVCFCRARCLGAPCRTLAKKKQIKHDQENKLRINSNTRDMPFCIDRSREAKRKTRRSFGKKHQRQPESILYSSTMSTTPAKKGTSPALNVDAGEKSRQPPKARIVLVDLKKNCGNKICAVFYCLMQQKEDHSSSKEPRAEPRAALSRSNTSSKSAARSIDRTGDWHGKSSIVLTQDLTESTR